MRIVVQRVREAAVHVGGEVVGRIGHGLLLLVGVARGDTFADAEALARKVPRLGLFELEGVRGLSLHNVGGACLVVSQFTLLATVRKGNRPGYSDAEEPARAQSVYEGFLTALRATGVPVETGRFGAMMQVHLVNDGPVTLLLEAQQGRVL